MRIMKGEQQTHAVKRGVDPKLEVFHQHGYMFIVNVYPSGSVPHEVQINVSNICNGRISLLFKCMN